MTITTFNNKPANVQRMLVAKDIISRVEIGKFVAQRGTYSEIKNYDVYSSTGGNESAQKVLRTNKCAVCAKGALVMSWVAMFNNKTVADVLGAEEIDEVNRIFPRLMRNAMEAAFEKFRYLTVSHSGTIAFNDEPKRWSLRRIMENIIRNNGDFVFNGYRYTDDGVIKD